MYQRLTLARDLLTENGVILVHINEEEVDRAGCLMDRVFPGRKVGKFVWRTRSGARVSKDYFVSIDHEYVLCYANKGFKFAGSAKTFATRTRTMTREAIGPTSTSPKANRTRTVQDRTSPSRTRLLGYGIHATPTASGHFPRRHVSSQDSGCSANRWSR